ncbi:hypothetical protein ACFQ51_50090 [Streptomyces kaempferi]
MRGANAYFAGTADSGAMAIGRAMRTVRRGEADVVLAAATTTPPAGGRCPRWTASAS